MMNIQWREPALVWLQAVPVLLLAVLVHAEWLRRRRLRRFGDSEVLGLSFRPAARIASILSIVLGTGAIAAIVPLPENGNGPGAEPSSAVLEVLLDSESLQTEADRGSADPWDRLEGLFSDLARRSGGMRIAVRRTAHPVETLIPATADMQGFLILGGELRYRWSRVRPNPLAECLRDCAEARPGRARSVLLVTCRRAAETERLASGPSRDRWTVARLPSDGGAVVYGVRNASGAWSYEAGRVDFAATAQAASSSSGGVNWIQLFGLAGFLLLAGESLFPWIVLSSGKREGN